MISRTWKIQDARPSDRHALSRSEARDGLGKKKPSSSDWPRILSQAGMPSAYRVIQNPEEAHLNFILKF